MKHVIYLTKVIALFAALSVSLTSCAALFAGSSDKVMITSDPPGSEVIIEGQYMGTTPVNFELNKDKTYTFEFRKDGYKSVSYKLEREVLWGYVALDVITGVVWLALDFGSYSCYSFEDKVHIVFDQPGK